MKGITFGNYHSFNDLHMILTSKEIGSPAVKVKKIDVEGADSSLDLTDYFGEAKYDDVVHKFDFSTIVPQDQFLSLFSTVKNAIHGKKMRIILDDDPLFYYVGRIHVSQFTSEKGIGTISVEADCEPWKYKLNETIVSETLDGYSKNHLDIHNLYAIDESIHITNDEFIILDKISEAITYYGIIFSKMNIKVLPNQQYTFVVEIKESYIDYGNAEFILISNSYINESCFDEVIRFLIENEHDSIKVFQSTSITGESFAESVLFMRSYFDLSPNTKANAKIRVSAIPNDTNIDDFVYTSYDGTMKGLKLHNSRKRVVPTITTNSPFTIYYEGNTFSISSGTFIIPEIELKEGINDIAVKGTGTISFTYQEAGL